jgi:hypothetical protein
LKRLAYVLEKLSSVYEVKEDMSKATREIISRIGGETKTRDEMTYYSQACAMVEETMMHHYNTTQKFKSSVLNSIVKPMVSWYKAQNKKRKDMEKELSVLSKALLAAQESIGKERKECLKMFVELRVLKDQKDREESSETQDRDAYPKLIKKYKSMKEKAFKAFQTFEKNLDKGRKMQINLYQREIPLKLQELEIIEKERLSLTLDALTKYQVIFSTMQIEIQHSVELLAKVLPNLNSERSLGGLLDKYQTLLGPPPPLTPIPYDLPCSPAQILNDVLDSANGAQSAAAQQTFQTFAKPSALTAIPAPATPASMPDARDAYAARARRSRSIVTPPDPIAPPAQPSPTGRPHGRSRSVMPGVGPVPSFSSAASSSLAPPQLPQKVRQRQSSSSSPQQSSPIINSSVDREDGFGKSASDLPPPPLMPAPVRNVRDEDIPPAPNAPAPSRHRGGDKLPVVDEGSHEREHSTSSFAESLASSITTASAAPRAAELPEEDGGPLCIAEALFDFSLPNDGAADITYLNFKPGDVVTVYQQVSLSLQQLGMSQAEGEEPISFESECIANLSQERVFVLVCLCREMNGGMGSLVGSWASSPAITSRCKTQRKRPDTDACLPSIICLLFSLRSPFSCALLITHQLSSIRTHIRIHNLYSSSDCTVHFHPCTKSSQASLAIHDMPFPSIPMLNTTPLCIWMIPAAFASLSLRCLPFGSFVFVHVSVSIFAPLAKFFAIHFCACLASYLFPCLILLLLLPLTSC